MHFLCSPKSGLKKREHNLTHTKTRDVLFHGQGGETKMNSRLQARQANDKAGLTTLRLLISLVQPCSRVRETALEKHKGAGALFWSTQLGHRLGHLASVNYTNYRRTTGNPNLQIKLPASKPFSPRQSFLNAQLSFPQ